MWFEILPSFLIISTVLAVPHFGAQVGNWLFIGKRFRRNLLEREDRFHYMRDIRLTGSCYVPSGIDCIPEE
ncbi:unnamed protein product [Phyllotreta striolata]|uniref:NADH dehydrogenase [ubiquinone] 1 alpha subcomplex subunit 1 n=1 Tax=Phyllotreta striolata TaxID=444603 RepID=A0A9N9TY76_PHYSR|nr:unnamed protein product [Phyllotreta striolata]